MRCHPFSRKPLKPLFLRVTAGLCLRADFLEFSRKYFLREDRYCVSANLHAGFPATGFCRRVEGAAWGEKQDFDCFAD
jgi:hypothetical protein